MNLTITIFNQAVIMFMIILIGILCYRLKLVTEGGAKELSSLVLQIVNPVTIFMAYQREFDSKLLKGLLISFFLSAIAFLVAIMISYTFVRKKEGREYDIERFTSVYSNCGFMGIPLISALLGLEGVFYLTAFLTIFNLLAWTHGVIQISGVRDPKSIKSALRSPAVISIFIGLVSFLLRAFLPAEWSQVFSESMFMKVLEYISQLNTPLAMIVAGASIAQVNVSAAVKHMRVYFITFIKLILIPFVIVIIFSFIPVERNPMITVIVAMSAPSATMSTLFCIKYGKNYCYSSEIFAVTTLLSVFTMPVVISFTNFMGII